MGILKTDRIAALVLALAMGVGGLAQPAMAAIGSVAEAQGRASVERQGQALALAAGSGIELNDVLTT
ncbi:MAG: hypothetical protein ACYCZX_16885, partial [Rhodospirillaceae bacterium]